MTNDLCLLVDFKEEEINFLLKESMLKRLSIYTIDNQSSIFELTPVQIANLRKTHPNRTTIYFKEPRFGHSGYESFGESAEVGLSDLWVNKVHVEKLTQKILTKEDSYSPEIIQNEKLAKLLPLLDKNNIHYCPELEIVVETAVSIFPGLSDSDLCKKGIQQRIREFLEKKLPHLIAKDNKAQNASLIKRIEKICTPLKRKKR